ncbi:site-specific integrase [Bacteroides uniformis]
MINKSNYTLSFTVRASKMNKAGKAPIEVLIAVGDERTVFSTGKLVALENWNKDKQCVRGTNSEAVVLNEFLKSLRVRIYEEEIKLVKHGFAITAMLLRDALLNKVELIKEETILNVYKRHNEMQHKQIGCGISKGTYANSKHGLSLLEKFIQSKYNRDDMFLRELNRDFIEEYRIWLLSEHGLSQNGAVKYLSLLKKVVNRAVANNKIAFNPFASYKLERQEVSPDFLNEDELRRIINFNSPLPRLERTRDMFLFACYTGLSYIDVKTLKVEHLERDNQGRMWIKKKRVKTGVLARIPLLPNAKMLIDKYAGGDTLMPIYSDKDINLYLKDIAILCHIERHTFASTVTLANNISLIVVSKMLGHSNTRMTEHYAKLVDKCIGEEMDKLMGTFCTKE